MMEYQIISATTVDDLAVKVNEDMDRGWSPIGGLTIYHVQSSLIQQGGNVLAQIQQHFAQTMIRFNSPAPKEPLM